MLERGQPLGGGHSTGADGQTAAGADGWTLPSRELAAQGWSRQQGAEGTPPPGRAGRQLLLAGTFLGTFFLFGSLVVGLFLSPDWGWGQGVFFLM